MKNITYSNYTKALDIMEREICKSNNRFLLMCYSNVMRAATDIIISKVPGDITATEFNTSIKYFLSGLNSILISLPQCSDEIHIIEEYVTAV